MATTTAIKIEGADKVIRNLETLAERTQKKILRKVVRKVQKPMVAAARQRVQRRTGQLRKSLGTIVKTYKNSVVAIAGPRTGFRIEVDGKPVDPIHYAHLVEGGHGGRIRARPYPFLQPAFEANKTQAMNSAISEIASEIEKEAERKANKTK